jgi:hypothetical protein
MIVSLGDVCRSSHVAPEIIEDTNEVAVKIGGHELARLPPFVQTVQEAPLM